MRANAEWSLVRLNLEEPVVWESFRKRAVGINEDIAKSLGDIWERMKRDGS